MKNIYSDRLWNVKHNIQHKELTVLLIRKTAGLGTESCELLE